VKRIGYLCSEFPALSHTFISREIAILEREGFEITTASINAATGIEKMSAEDQAYAARTYFIKGSSWISIGLVVAKYALDLPHFFPALAYAVQLTAFSGPRNLRKTMGYFVEALLLHAWATDRSIEHIHVHFANPAATVALIARKFGRLEFSLSVHGPDEFYDVKQNNILEKIEAAIFVRCIGYYCRSQLMRLSPMEQWHKFHIIRCGLFKGEFLPRQDVSNVVRNILCVGRLCPSKGQAVLVEAASLLHDRGLDFHILLLGGGENLEEIRSMVTARNLGAFVSVAGSVGHSRVKDELAACDLFVLPSFAEGIPVALMEAMASGIPVVSTNIMGIPELIENGFSGILTQPSNSGQLADAIEALIRGRVDTAKLTGNAAETVRAQYDVQENSKKLGDLFLGLRSAP